MSTENISDSNETKALSQIVVSGSWFDATKYHPQIGDKIEFVTNNGIKVVGECVNRHSVGVYWAINWGYFPDKNIVMWRFL